MSSPSLPFVSVVLCAHNPRGDHLHATLESLRSQDLPLSQWELIVVDNASNPSVGSRHSLSWHPHGRIVIEAELGLARARRRGYIESKGDLVIHSDDDNLLTPDYLTRAQAIYVEHPHIGAFGGQVVPRFENPPQTALERLFGAERRLDHDLWSNIFDDNRTMPFGAGMCLRRAVIVAYLDEVEKDPRRLVLGRTGTRLITGEDVDLNYVAVRHGFGTGLFRSLVLTHFIPPEHMTADHVIRYRAGNAYSMVLLQFLHLGHINILKRSPAGALMFWTRVWLRMSPFERRLEIAMHRARWNAVRDIRAWGWSETSPS